MILGVFCWLGIGGRYNDFCDIVSNHFVVSNFNVCGGYLTKKIRRKRICSYRAMRYFLVYHFYLIGFILLNHEIISIGR